MSTEDAQKGMLVETGNGEGSREVVQVGEQIGHRLRFHLKARHGWRFTADDLVHEHRIVALLADPNKFWTNKPLSGEAMATGAVDAEQLPAMVGGAWEIEAGAYVGILAGVAQHPKHENNASCGCQHNEGCDETTTSFWLFSCS